LGRAGIDQHQVVAGVDQVGVDRSLHAFLGRHEHARQQRLQVLVIDALEQAGRQVDVAVIQSGDFEVPECHAVVARYLGLLLCRCGGL